jgi:hypothetical protein
MILIRDTFNPRDPKRPMGYDELDDVVLFHMAQSGDVQALEELKRRNT